MQHLQLGFREQFSKKGTTQISQNNVNLKSREEKECFEQYENKARRIVF